MTHPGYFFHLADKHAGLMRRYEALGLEALRVSLGLARHAPVVMLSTGRGARFERMRSRTLIEVRPILKRGLGNIELWNIADVSKIGPVTSDPFDDILP